MQRFSSYIFGNLFTGLILIAASLTCVVWLSQSLRFVDMIVNRGLSAGMFIYLTGLMIPNFLTVIFPVSLFTIATFTYHRMIMDRELMVMSAAGVSNIKHARPAFLMAMLLVAFGYALSTYLVPMSYTKFRELQWDIRYSFSHVLLREGTFNDVSDGVTVYVRERLDNGQLLGILAHDDRNEQHTFTLMSERGAMVQSDQGTKVVMFNGSRQDFDKKTKQLTILYFDRYVFELQVPSNTEQERHKEGREYLIEELIDLHRNGELETMAGGLLVELHRRIALPWSALGFVMIALSVLMSGSFSRRGEGKRVFAAVILAAGYQAALLTILNLATKNYALIPGIYAVTAFPVVAGGVVFAITGRVWRKSDRAPHLPHEAL